MSAKTRTVRQDCAVPQGFHDVWVRQLAARDRLHGLADVGVCGLAAAQGPANLQ